MGIADAIAERIAASPLAKATVHVGEYTRTDPRSGKLVRVSSYDRSVVAQLVSKLDALGPGGKVDLPGGLGSVRRNSEDRTSNGIRGGYTGFDAKGYGVGTYRTPAEAVGAIAHSNGGGSFSRTTGRRSGGGKLHPNEHVVPDGSGPVRKAVEPGPFGAGLIPSHLSDLALRKERVDVSAYTRTSPSGKVVHVSTYKRNVLEALVSNLTSGQTLKLQDGREVRLEGGKVAVIHPDVPNPGDGTYQGLSTRAAASDGGYKTVHGTPTGAVTTIRRASAKSNRTGSFGGPQRHRGPAAAERATAQHRSKAWEDLARATTSSVTATKEGALQELAQRDLSKAPPNVLRWLSSSTNTDLRSRARSASQGRSQPATATAMPGGPRSGGARGRARPSQPSGAAGRHAGIERALDTLIPGGRTSVDMPAGGPPERFDSTHLQAGDVVVDHEGNRYTVHGTARYAGGSGSTGHRTPGVSVRPEGGGRARVMAESRFASMERNPQRTGGGGTGFEDDTTAGPDFLPVNELSTSGLYEVARGSGPRAAEARAVLQQRGLSLQNNPSQSTRRRLGSSGLRREGEFTDTMGAKVYDADGNLVGRLRKGRASLIPRDVAAGVRAPTTWYIYERGGTGRRQSFRTKAEAVAELERRAQQR